MPWVGFSVRKPVEGNQLITRFRGYNRRGDCFETHHKWDKKQLEICYPDGTGHISHWWDGEYDFDLAIKEWYGASTASGTAE